jgi:hypothetical protein
MLVAQFVVVVVALALEVAPASLEAVSKPELRFVHPLD